MSVRYLPSEVSVQVTVVPAVTEVPTKITITEPKPGQTVYAGQPFWIRGRLTDQQGNPLPNMSVEVYLDNYRAATVKTASDGTFQLQAVFETVGTHTVKVRFPGT